MTSRLVLSILFSAIAAAADHPRIPEGYRAPYPLSTFLTGLTFDDSSERTLAPGSDIWPITWAADGHLYTVWGDGGGFGGTNKDGRVSLGVGRVEGPRSGYRGANIAGGKDAPNPAPFTGKSEGILAIGNTLYLWRDGELSNELGFKWLQLHRSDDHGATWRFTGVRFSKDDGDFPAGDEGLFAPAFCQFGQGYKGARDQFIYIYAPDIIDRSHWGMRVPGHINLIRVPVNSIEEKSKYEFFSGFDPKKSPRWAPKAAARKPVWSDPINGNHRSAVSYNPELRRYLLTTVTVSRDGWMSLYEAPEPWGPWSTVLVEQNRPRWGTWVILYTFVNKWLSSDGRNFVLVHTKNDSWATIEGTFHLAARP